MPKDGVEGWIRAVKSTAVNNADPMAGIRFFEAHNHVAVEGYGNGVIQQGAFTSFHTEDWAIREFLDLWECEVIPSLRPTWTRCIATSGEWNPQQLRMVDMSGQPLSCSWDSAIDFEHIDSIWGTPSYNPWSQIGPSLPDTKYNGPHPGRIQCTAIYSPIVAMVKHTYAGSTTVSDPLPVDPGRLCVWPEIHRVSSREILWKWHAAIFCWRNFSFEGPAHWGDGVQAEVNNRLMPVIREWSHLGRFFQNANLTEAGYYDLIRQWTAEYFSGPRDGKIVPFWKEPNRRNDPPPNVDSDMKL